MFLPFFVFLAAAVSCYRIHFARACLCSVRTVCICVCMFVCLCVCACVRFTGYEGRVFVSRFCFFHLFLNSTHHHIFPPFLSGRFCFCLFSFVPCSCFCLNVFHHLRCRGCTCWRCCACLQVSRFYIIKKARTQPAWTSVEGLVPLFSVLNRLKEKES